jgi:hypothetical protein
MNRSPFAQVLEQSNDFVHEEQSDMHGYGDAAHH